MKKKIVLLIALGCFFTPLIFIIYSLSIGIFESTETFSNQQVYNIFHKIVNSLLLCLGVSMLSVSFGLITTFSFFTLVNLWQRILLLLLLFMLFSISPIIYLVALSKFYWFNHIEIYIQVISSLAMSFFPLASLLLIFTFSSINFSSIQLALMNASMKNVFKFIILPQLYRPIAAIFLMLFILVFIHEEVPSFLGYRTYAEEFLSRIVAMENIYDLSFITIPFILMAVFTLMILNKLMSKIDIEVNNLNDTYYYSHFYIFSLSILMVLGSIVLFLIGILINEFINNDIRSLLQDNISPVINSIILSIIAGTIGTLFSYFFYNIIFQNSTKYLSSIVVFGMILYWLIPSSLSSLVLIEVSSYLIKYSFFSGYTLLLFAYLIKIVPIGILLLVSLNFLKTSDYFLQLNSLEKKGIFKYITIPLNWSKWLFLVMVLTIFSLNELSSTVLLIPPGEETIIVKMYNLMHYGDFSSVAFLSLLQVSIIGIAVLVLGYSIKRQYDYT